jgi:hypothetical protein
LLGFDLGKNKLYWAFLRGMYYQGKFEVFEIVFKIDAYIPYLEFTSYGNHV